MLWDQVIATEVMGGNAGVSKQLRLKGCLVGPNFDLIEGVDLSDPSKVDELRAYIREKTPFVVICTNPCTLMGSWSYINEAKNPEDFKRRWPLAKKLSYLSAEICNMQHDAGRYFLAEHPQNSKQWSLPAWKKLLKRKGVHKVKGDQCIHGLVCPEGRPIQKRTCFVSNSLLLVQPLAKFCKGISCLIDKLLALSKDICFLGGVKSGHRACVR